MNPSLLFTQFRWPSECSRRNLFSAIRDVASQVSADDAPIRAAIVRLNGLHCSDEDECVFNDFPLMLLSDTVAHPLWDRQWHIDVVLLCGRALQAATLHVPAHCSAAKWRRRTKQLRESFDQSAQRDTGCKKGARS